MMHKKIVVVIMLCIFAAAVYFRVGNLGKFGFWWDELYHVNAAQGIIENGRPFIPPIGDYTRALPITYSVVAMFKMFGASEAAARFPSVVVNLIFVILSFFIVRKLTNTATAVLFFIVMCFSPFEITMARECRMYALFQLLYFLMVYFFYRGFEYDNGKHQLFKRVEAAYGINIVYLMLAAGIGLFSLCIHVLTVNIYFVVLSYAVIMAAFSVKQGGIKHALTSKYGILMLILISSFIAGNILTHGRVIRMLMSAGNLPGWYTKWEPTGPMYYRYFLSNNYPALFFIFPLGSLILMMKERKRGVFIFLNFAVLMLMHNFLYARKLDRYIFYIFPFFVISAVFAWDIIFRAIGQRLRKECEGAPRLVVLMVIFAVLMAFNVFGYPWMGESKNVMKEGKFQDWKTIPSDLIEQIRAGKVITTRNDAYQYYFKDIADWYLRYSYDEYFYVYDKKYGMKVIDTLYGLKSVFNEVKEDLFLVADRWTFTNDTIVTPAMREFIVANTEQIHHAGDNKIYIFKRIRSE
jgi:4-amino-4-deoxy-L-arabinose transferase-like glycosyltransferase